MALLAATGTAQRCCTPDGAGVCRNKNTFRCMNGDYYSGHCPGPANIQCCVRRP